FAYPGAGAAGLGGGGRLRVVGLEVDPQLLAVDEASAARDAPPPQALCGFCDVPGRDHATSWASGLGTWTWAWPWPWTWAREPASRRRRPPRHRRPRLPSPRAPRPRRDRRA